MKRFSIFNFASAFVFSLAILFFGAVDGEAQSRPDSFQDRYGNGTRFERRQRDRERRNRNDVMSRRDVNVLLLQGYEQGLHAGRLDRSRGKFNASNVYRNTPARPYSGDSSSTDYLYRQGYLEGYQDGYYGRLRY